MQFAHATATMGWEDGDLLISGQSYLWEKSHTVPKFMERGGVQFNP